MSLIAAAVGCDGGAAGVSARDGAAREGTTAAETDEPRLVAEPQRARDRTDVATEDGQKPSVNVAIKPWDEIVQAATSEGRPVVIDVWSLSCEPCLKSFPELVDLHKKLGDRVKCVSANVDFDGRRTRPPESYESRVQEFLQVNKSTLANYISATPSDEVYAELEIPSIPAVLVFDAEGQEVARFVDAGETVGFSYREDIIPFVRKLIAGGEPTPSPAGGTADE